MLTTRRCCGAARTTTVWFPRTRWRRAAWGPPAAPPPAPLPLLLLLLLLLLAPPRPPPTALRCGAPRPAVSDGSTLRQQLVALQPVGSPAGGRGRGGSEGLASRSCEAGLLQGYPHIARYHTTTCQQLPTPASRGRHTTRVKGGVESSRASPPHKAARGWSHTPCRHFKTQSCCCLGSAFEVAAFQTLASGSFLPHGLSEASA